MTTDYTFVVYNDAKEFPDFSNFGNMNIRKEIEQTCSRLNIPCIPIPNSHHQVNISPSWRTADALNFILANQKFQGGKHLVLDSDMFLMKPLNWATDFDDYDAVLLHQQRDHVRYCWNGIAYLNMDTLQPAELLAWNDGYVEGIFTDTGGAMSHFLNRTQNRIRWMSHLSSGRWTTEQFPLDCDLQWLNFLLADPRNTGGNFFAEIYDSAFFHYRAGGNWENRNAAEYSHITGLLERIIRNICS